MKRVFIVGCPRSGTTLLQLLLAANTRFTSLPETHFFRWLVPSSPARYLGLCSRQGRHLAVKHMKEIGTPLRFSKSLYLSDWTNEFVKALDKYTISSSFNGWIEKTPKHLHYLSIIEKHIPDALFIHILRKGTDAVASLYEACNLYPESWGGPRSAMECAIRWKTDVERSLSKSSSPRHKLISYDHLVSAPHDVIPGVLEFLGEPKPSNAISNEISLNLFNSVALRTEPWKEYKSSISGQTSKFHSVLSPADQIKVLSIINQVNLPLNF
jgi:hypothetical protein